MNKPTNTNYTGIAGLLDTGATAVDKVVDEGLQHLRYASWSANQWIDGNVLPSWQAGLQLQRAFRGSVLDVVAGKRKLADLAKDTGERVRSGVRFQRLMNTLGKEAYGSARFDGEEELGRDSGFKLSYLPPKAGVTPVDVAIFHAGGVIPYGEGIFRLTNEYNLFERFRERGMPVYVMEIAGDSSTVDYAHITMDAIIRATERLSTLAFEHNKGRKMALEGYCGSGTQSLAYLAAMPEDVEKKFSVFVTFVTPVDGKKCGKLAEQVQRTPMALADAQLGTFEALGMTVPPDMQRVGLDLTLGAVMAKSSFGYFTAGWMRDDLARVKTMEDLTPQQRRDLAGAYWISADSARRFPVPVDVSRYTSKMFSDGVAPDGRMPWSFEGRPLSLGDVAAKTTIRTIGVFGAEDPVIPDRTGHVMMQIFGDRYQHVVHPGMGHISYVLTPRAWQQGARGMQPNPVDLILAAAKQEAGA
ncbi:MAG: hypothetical protein EP329_16880 [Deltaproteobacteria bacterium]|nr:MAG: hypothetical protein EP329_16880 [Deltaproteobacteria bacterium]